MCKQNIFRETFKLIYFKSKKVYNLQNFFWLMFFKNVNMKDTQFLLWKIVLYY